MKAEEHQTELAAQIAVLESLHHLAGQKREALLKEDLDTLLLVNQEEEKELEKLKRLTPPAEDETGEPAPEVKELLLTREFLARRIRELNLLNRELIADSLAFIQFSLQLLQGRPECSFYGTTGTKEPPAVNSLIDVKG